MSAKAKSKSSASKDLVSVGPRDVFNQSGSKQGKRNGPVQKETTTRALVLRNGKHGARGTGEIMLMKKMSGREKMDLLAEDLLAKSKKAILNPFRLEKCLKIAESQSDAYVDDIANLRDPDLFRHLIEAELNARTEPTRKDPRRNPSHVAKLVATRVHNALMLASAWKIVSDSLNGLAIDGLTDRNIKMKLKSDPDMRDRYLVLYDLVNVLVDMSQDRFSVLATTTPHYAKYFKLKPTESTDPGESEYVFDWSDLRGAADSYIDSIIIELCFPRGTYPKAILYQLLSEATAESPREAKRFPQALWDAVGDLSVSVQLQEQLDAPLFGAEGETWKKQPRQMPEEYENWIDAQIYSRKASDMFASFKDIIFPLEKTRSKSVIENMWKHIHMNYRSVSGQDADTLWGLSGAFDYEPQWSSYLIPDIKEESDDDDLPRLKSVKDRKKQKRLAISDRPSGYDSHDSMPGLQSVSNTSDEGSEEFEDDDSDDDEEEGSSDEESGYDTEEEDEIRDLLREAMDAAHEADFFDAEDNIPPEIDPFQQEDRKGNPFLKLLGSLRGMSRRMFSSDPKLKTASRTEPRTGPARGAFRATPSGVPKPVPSTIPSKPASALPTAKSSAPSASTQDPTPPKSQKATVEDVEDEDEVSVAGKKKKKKKPKKKKKATSPDVVPGSPSPSLQSMDSMSTSAAQSFLPPSLSSPKKATPVVSQPPSSPSKGSSKPAPSFTSSTTSLPVGENTIAQSAHAYLQSRDIKLEKKVKSRPDHASLFSNPDEGKKGLFSKFSIHKKDQEVDPKTAKQSWFSKLGKKTTGLMHQLLQTTEDRTDGRAPMKWESFLKLMREMGFEYDPSTAGSSVRFDPPNKNDRPITFHKPHPDPTIQPVKLKEWAKRLKRYYGWDEEDLLRI